jgi:hypothetical protein
MTQFSKICCQKSLQDSKLLVFSVISQSKITLARHIVITDYMEVKITALRRPRLARCSNKIFLKVSMMVPRLRRSDSKVLVTLHAWPRPCGCTVGYSSIHTVTEHSWTALHNPRVNYLTSAEILCRNFSVSLRGYKLRLWRKPLPSGRPPLRHLASAAKLSDFHKIRYRSCFYRSCRSSSSFTETKSA